MKKELHKIESVMIHMVGTDVELLIRDRDGNDTTVTGSDAVKAFFKTVKITPTGLEISMPKR